MPRRHAGNPLEPLRFALPICINTVNVLAPSGGQAQLLPKAERAPLGFTTYMAASPDFWPMPWPSSRPPARAAAVNTSEFGRNNNTKKPGPV